MRAHSFAAALIPLVAATSWGQVPPNIDPKEIKEKVKKGVADVLASSEEKTVSLEGIVKITYKEMPTNPKKIAEILQQSGKLGQLPPNTDIDQYIGMFQNDITEMLNENLANLGTIEALVPLKLRSKRIPVGTWNFGFAFDGERPIALVITGEGLPKDGKPIPIELKTRSVDLQDVLSLEIVEPKKQKEGKEKFDIRVAFMRTVAQSKAKLERTSAD